MKELNNPETEKLLIRWLRLNPVSSNTPNKKMFYDFVISLFEDGDELDDKLLEELAIKETKLKEDILDDFVNKTLDEITEFKRFLNHLEEIGKLDI